MDEELLIEFQTENNSWLAVSFAQLKLLLWKHYKQQVRSKFMTTLEIIVPAIFVMILLPIRSVVNSEIFSSNTLYKPFSIEKLPSDLTPFKLDFDYTKIYPDMPKRGALWNFAYQPDNSLIVNKIMAKVSKKLHLNMIPYPNERSMLNYLTNTSNTFTLGGASFLNTNINNFTYELRFSYGPKNARDKHKTFKQDQDWETQFLYFLFPILGPRERSENDGGDPGYAREGFLEVQKAIDFALIGQFNTTVNDIDLKLQRFSFPPYNNDKFVAVIAAFLPFVVVISFVFTIILTAKAIVHEKETGLKEAMKLMGMKPWIYWLSWYIKTFLLLIPAIILMVFCFKYKVTLKNGSKASIIKNSDTYLLTVFFLFYASSSITFMFVCTTLFKKANSAAAGAGVIWLLSYLPFMFISLRYEKMTHFLKLAICFVNNLSMSEGLFMIGQYEGKNGGLSFSNWRDGFIYNDTFSFSQILFIMFLNNFIHIILTCYLENVIPGNYGITKPWYFPISSFFAKKKIRHIKRKSSDALNVSACSSLEDQEYFEDESIYSSRNIGIRVQNIRKTFKQLGKIKTAVKNLSMNIYEGQISVLLGHNGAGKSTTMSMITGLTTPTDGKIYVKDKDIVQETDEARSVLGYCPQHNLLFDELTVQEHLYFFSKLKRNYNQTEINEMLELINLSDKINSRSKTLSGGMKRKLSVAIAFIGGSKIVILDEPSSGMDPQARHSTWSLLQKFKKEKDVTILLTTHFMDEADFLGDRIAIMSQGELKCCGSPLFLKSKYGSGYNMVLTRNQAHIEDQSKSHDKEHLRNRDQKSVEEITNIVIGQVPNSRLVSNVNSELGFVLPSEESSQFPRLFEILDQRKEELNILNVGISITTLEEVFLKINEDEDMEEINENNPKNEGTSVQHAYNNEAMVNDPEDTTEPLSYEIDETYGLWVGSSNDDLYKGITLAFQQFSALIMKRIINSMRNKTLIISQLVIPVGILLVNLLYVKYAPIKAEDSPPLQMNLEKYNPNFVPYTSSGQSSSLSSNLMTTYANQFRNISNSQAFSLDSNSTVDWCRDQRNNIDDFIGCVGSVNFQTYIDNYIVAAEFSETNKKTMIKAFFNNQPFHVVPLTLNLVSNSILKYFNGKGSITVINHPLPRNLQEIVQDLTTKNQTGFQVGSGLAFGFSFLLASFVIFLIKERTSDAKHLQYMSGSGSNVFFISAFIWDMLNYLIPCILVIILLAIFDIEAYLINARWLICFLLLFLYGMAHIPQMYIFSYIFKVSSTGFASLVAFNILTSQATLLPVAILSLPQLDLVYVSTILEWIFIVIFPNFSLAQGFSDMYINDAIGSQCKMFEPFCPLGPNPCCYNYNNDPFRCGPNGEDDCYKFTNNFLDWEKPGLGRFVVFLPIQFIVLMTFVLIYEAGYIRRFIYGVKKSFSGSSDKKVADEVDTNSIFNDIPKDIDVINEENRISSLNINKNNNEIFIVDQLTKYYGNFMAVKGISFTLNKSQCFGLLGVNGAGKTSTFKMITGDTFVTRGDAYVNKSSLKTNIKDFQRQLGYCPQFDPLIDQMTVKETMIMYAMLRGIKYDLINKTIMSLIKLLDLSDHVEKMCYTLSGGNKRKLSVAIALVGSPTVILLDEPTSGMDPKTRRILWNTLNKIRNKGKSLILTTHGMDETEALCTNIGIMVNGELKCLGSLQHLQSKYGEGYTLLAKIPIQGNNDSQINKFINLILSSFKDSVLKENRDGFINIHINNNDTSELANIFKLVEQSKEEYTIEYYVVTQTKLEQIFLNFASKQFDPESRILQKKRWFC